MRAPAEQSTGVSCSDRRALRRSRPIASMLLAVVLLAGCTWPWSSEPTTVVPGGAAEELIHLITALRVEPEPPRQGYSRDLFDHWADINGSGCRARSDVLAAQAIGLVQRDPVSPCTIVEGDWYSAFDGQTHAGHPSEIDVDHVVALAEAWDSGAAEWSYERRRQFANDPLNLLVSTRQANQDKADLDAGEWSPPRRDAWCLTGTMMTLTKLRYDLRVDRAERDGLIRLAMACDRSDQVGTATIPMPGTAAFGQLARQILDERDLVWVADEHDVAR